MVIRAIDLGAVLDELTGRPHLAKPCRQMQRGDALCILCIHIGTRGHQCFDGIGLIGSRGQMQRGLLLLAGAQIELRALVGQRQDGVGMARYGGVHERGHVVVATGSAIGRHTGFEQGAGRVGVACAGR